MAGLTGRLRIIATIDSAGVGQQLQALEDRLRQFASNVQANSGRAMIANLARGNRQAQRSQRAFNNEQRDTILNLRRLTHGLRSLGHNVSSGYEKVDTLGAALDAASISMWKFIVSAIPMQVIAMRFAGILAALGGLVAWGGRGIALMEELHASLEEVTGSAQRASERIEFLWQFAAETPFTMEQVSQAGFIVEQLSEKVKGSYTELMHAAATLAAGTTGRGHDIVRAAQAMLAGVSGNLGRLTRTFYISKTEIAEAAEGAIDAQGRIVDQSKFMEGLVRVIYERFGDVLKKQLDTVGGQWSMTMDRLQSSARLWGQTFRGIIMTVINALNRLLDTMNALLSIPAVRSITAGVTGIGMALAGLVIIVTKAASALFDFAGQLSFVGMLLGKGAKRTWDLARLQTKSMQVTSRVADVVVERLKRVFETASAADIALLELQRQGLRGLVEVPNIEELAYISDVERKISDILKGRKGVELDVDVEDVSDAAGEAAEATSEAVREVAESVSRTAEQSTREAVDEARSSVRRARLGEAWRDLPPAPDELRRRLAERQARTSYVQRMRRRARDLLGAIRARRRAPTIVIRPEDLVEEAPQVGQVLSVEARDLVEDAARRTRETSRRLAERIGRRRMRRLRRIPGITSDRIALISRIRRLVRASSVSAAVAGAAVDEGPEITDSLHSWVFDVEAWNQWRAERARRRGWLARRWQRFVRPERPFQTWRGLSDISRRLKELAAAARRSAAETGKFLPKLKAFGASLLSFLLNPITLLIAAVTTFAVVVYRAYKRIKDMEEKAKRAVAEQRLAVQEELVKRYGAAGIAVVARAGVGVTDILSDIRSAYEATKELRAKKRAPREAWTPHGPVLVGSEEEPAAERLARENLESALAKAEALGEEFRAIGATMEASGRTVQGVVEDLAAWQSRVTQISTVYDEITKDIENIQEVTSELIGRESLSVGLYAERARLAQDNIVALQEELSRLRVIDEYLGKYILYINSVIDAQKRLIEYQGETEENNEKLKELENNRKVAVQAQADLQDRILANIEAQRNSLQGIDEYYDRQLRAAMKINQAFTFTRNFWDELSEGLTTTETALFGVQSLFTSVLDDIYARQQMLLARQQIEGYSAYRAEQIYRLQAASDIIRNWLDMMKEGRLPMPTPAQAQAFQKILPDSALVYELANAVKAYVDAMNQTVQSRIAYFTDMADLNDRLLRDAAQSAEYDAQAISAQAEYVMWLQTVVGLRRGNLVLERALLDLYRLQLDARERMVRRLQDEATQLGTIADVAAQYADTAEYVEDILAAQINALGRLAEAQWAARDLANAWQTMAQDREAQYKRTTFWAERQLEALEFQNQVGQAIYGTEFNSARITQEMVEAHLAIAEAAMKLGKVEDARRHTLEAINQLYKDQGDIIEQIMGEGPAITDIFGFAGREMAAYMRLFSPQVVGGYIGRALSAATTLSNPNMGRWSVRSAQYGPGTYRFELYAGPDLLNVASNTVQQAFDSLREVFR